MSKTNKTRLAAVAGTFYPNDKKTLNGMIDDFLNEALDLEVIPKAIIAPHAGYIYSGAIAASAYKTLFKIKNKIKKIVLLGPSHHVFVKGLAFPENDYFETPLGKIKIDQKTIKSLPKLPQISVSDKAHSQEHSLEVHLPFLQRIFGDKFELIPAVVGNSNPQEVGEVLEKLWGGEETLVIISTDLSHYHSYEEAYQLDRETYNDIENLEIQKLHPEKLCGALPVSGLLYVAKKKGLQIKMVDFCNSGDIEQEGRSINQDKVVGYASFVCCKKEDMGYILSKPQKRELLEIARGTIEYIIETGEPPEYLETLFNFDEETPIATFVTLKINGELRGCIGTLEASQNILQDVAYNACSAAFNDPRFSKLKEEELEELDISISILSNPETLEFKSEADLLKKIRPGVDGLILSEASYRGTFLPSVWEEITTAKDFLEHLKVKAGLPKDYWSEDIKIQRYTAQLIDESVM